MVGGSGCADAICGDERPTSSEVSDCFSYGKAFPTFYRVAVGEQNVSAPYVDHSDVISVAKE